MKSSKLRLTGCSHAPSICRPTRGRGHERLVTKVEHGPLLGHVLPRRQLGHAVPIRWAAARGFRSACTGHALERALKACLELHSSRYVPVCLAGHGSSLAQHTSVAVEAGGSAREQTWMGTPRPHAGGVFSLQPGSRQLPISARSAPRRAGSRKTSGGSCAAMNFPSRMRATSSAERLPPSSELAARATCSCSTAADTGADAAACALPWRIGRFRRLSSRCVRLAGTLECNPGCSTTRGAMASRLRPTRRFSSATLRGRPPPADGTPMGAPPKCATGKAGSLSLRGPDKRW